MLSRFEQSYNWGISIIVGCNWDRIDQVPMDSKEHIYGAIKARSVEGVVSVTGYTPFGWC